MTWKQLGLHDKPIVIVDVVGYWQPLLRLLDHAIAAGFAPANVRDALTVVGSPEEMIAALKVAPEPQVPPMPERA